MVAAAEGGSLPEPLKRPFRVLRVLQHNHGNSEREFALRFWGLLRLPRLLSNLLSFSFLPPPIPRRARVQHEGTFVTNGYILTASASF